MARSDSSFCFNKGARCLACLECERVTDFRNFRPTLENMPPLPSSSEHLGPNYEGKATLMKSDYKVELSQISASDLALASRSTSVKAPYPRPIFNRMPFGIFGSHISYCHQTDHRSVSQGITYGQDMVRYGQQIR